MGVNRISKTQFSVIRNGILTHNISMKSWRCPLPNPRMKTGRKHRLSCEFLRTNFLGPHPWGYRKECYLISTQFKELQRKHPINVKYSLKISQNSLNTNELYLMVYKIYLNLKYSVLQSKLRFVLTISINLIVITINISGITFHSNYYKFTIQSKIRYFTRYPI